MINLLKLSLVLILNTSCSRYEDAGFSNMKKFSKCSEKPNCVCSLYESEKHFIDPMNFDSNPIQKVKSVLTDLGFVIKAINTEYIHAIAISKIMKFKDDVEVMYDPQTKKLHFKSASRVGYSDLGANRRRVEKIKSLL